MTCEMDLKHHGIHARNVLRNLAPARFYEEAVRYEGASITSTGALAASSGLKTGRSPKDKRIVDDPETSRDVWWGDVNLKLEHRAFLSNRQRAIDYLNTRDRIYVIDGFAGWDPRFRLKVRVVCARAYHALFMHNMLIRPSQAELEDFGTPDCLIVNAGQFPADRQTDGLTSSTSVALNLKTAELIILGTEYAGEMKKGVFTMVNYLLPKRGVLSMHCAANEGEGGDVSLFFGLSGTGKTTLSADPNRKLIGDDEHCWTDSGIFNVEGGCYAKCLNLSPEREPLIHDAIRFGCVLENVVLEERDRSVDFDDGSVTENTRASYPIELIPNAKVPGLGPHPRNIFFLACDAFGVLPPVSKLTPAQAMY
ncbi:MAG: phosphoenolpyruvate carboxykinase (ATP), partial [Planctomycetes bacterium]|nr:phosphoenolpyruvate carboxykinase (ATP) [Planctomycetota bacterium]